MVAKANTRNARKGMRSWVNLPKSYVYDPNLGDLTQGRTKSPIWGMEVR